MWRKSPDRRNRSNPLPPSVGKLPLAAGSGPQPAPAWFLRTRSAAQDTPCWLRNDACVFTSHSEPSPFAHLVTPVPLKFLLHVLVEHNGVRSDATVTQITRAHYFRRSDERHSVYAGRGEDANAAGHRPASSTPLQSAVRERSPQAADVSARIFGVVTSVWLSAPVTVTNSVTRAIARLPIPGRFGRRGGARTDHFLLSGRGRGFLVERTSCRRPSRLRNRALPCPRLRCSRLLRFR